MPVLRSPCRVAGHLALPLLAMLVGATAARSDDAVKGKTIQNETLQVTVDAEDGSFCVRWLPGDRAVIPGGRLGDGGGTAEVVPADHETFGTGQAIELSHLDGSRDRLMLFAKLPFVLFQSTLKNGGAEPAVVSRLRRIRLDVDLAKPADGLRAYGTGGLTAPDGHSGSYAYLVIADPKTRSGLVAGWLTHDRGSGVVFSTVDDGQIRMDGQIDYGRLRIDPGHEATTETLAFGYFDDARLGLEAYADAIARVYAIKLPPQPAGYCTWYSDKHGGASDEAHLAELAAFAAERLKPFGFQFVQIDDRWQDGQTQNGPAKVFVRARPDGPYPGGMKAAADNITGLGLTPGIWFMPFAGNHNDPFFADHLDWFVKRPDGQPYETRWGGTSLDMTRPEAREYAQGVVRRIADDWGYRFFKMDGLYTGAATEQIYVNDGYREDGIGEAVFHDAARTNVEAYRDGLKLVRRAAGEEVFLLGCCVSQNMRSFGGSFGLVDAMRVGPDTGSGRIGAPHGSRHYFLHGRVWYNDPDCVSVRANLPLEQARMNASWTAVTGQLFYNSDWLPGLPDERLDILKRTIPSHGLLPRPVDLFENDPPQIWLLTDQRRTPRRDVVGLFNWGEGPIELDCPLEWIGLQAETTCLAFDYWSNQLLSRVEGRLRVSVPARSCRILAVRPVAGHPQLVSTSRHVTQGIVDVLEERWDESAGELSGRSRVVGGDPYELRIAPASVGERGGVPSVKVSGDDQAAGVRIASFPKGAEAGLLRVVIESPTGRDVDWSVRFARSP